MEDRLQECLDDHQGLEIDTENDGAIMCIGTVGEEGAVTFMFQYFPAGLPEKVKGIIQQKKPVIICDQTGDWSLGHNGGMVLVSPSSGHDGPR